MTTIERIVIHCAATPADMDIGFLEINDWHIKRGFNGFGYSSVLRRSGVLEMGRPEGAELAHARGFNKGSIAICLVGGVDGNGQAETNFTAEQRRSLRTMIDFFGLKYPDAVVLGHRDLPNVNKDCPCFDVKTWLASGVMEGAKKK